MSPGPPPSAKHRAGARARAPHGAGQVRTLPPALARWARGSAFAETVLRQPAIPLVSLAEIEAWGVSVLALGAAVALVDLTGPGLSQLGLDARFLSGPYKPCDGWAYALHDHPARPGGILYPSRFAPPPALRRFLRPGRPASGGPHAADAARRYAAGGGGGPGPLRQGARSGWMNRRRFGSVFYRVGFDFSVNFVERVIDGGRRPRRPFCRGVDV